MGEIRNAYGQRFGRRHPWDRVFHEAIGRRPGWHHRIRWELRLHYGAHLHRRLFLWFGATIFLAVVATAVAAHFGHGWLAAHPLRAVLLFGVPAVTLWTATGRVARRIAQPLYELTRAAQELGAGNLKARVSAAGFGFDETAVLSSAFNEMAARLERQLAEERELLASVSHELRTPLARIRLLVEIGRQAGAGQGGQGTIRARWTRSSARRSRSTRSWASSWPARGSSSRPWRPKPLDAVEVARRALERAGEDAAKLVSAPPPIPFAADPTLIGRALANLIDNARKHGSGLVRLAVRADGAGVTFEVVDRGPRLRARRREPRVRAVLPRGRSRRRLARIARPRAGAGQADRRRPRRPRARRQRAGRRRPRRPRAPPGAGAALSPASHAGRPAAASSRGAILAKPEAD